MAKPPWKLITPADVNQELQDAGGVTWKYCKDRDSGKVGIYTLSHTTSGQIVDFRPASTLADVTEEPEVPDGDRGWGQ
jgi:hypothetical protein